jgi:hypothetical protein
MTKQLGCETSRLAMKVPFQIIQQFQRRLRDLAVSAVVAGAAARDVGVAEQGDFDEDFRVAPLSQTKFDAAT